MYESHCVEKEIERTWPVDWGRGLEGRIWMGIGGIKWGEDGGRRSWETQLESVVKFKMGENFPSSHGISKKNFNGSPLWIHMYSFISISPFAF